MGYSSDFFDYISCRSEEASKKIKNRVKDRLIKSGKYDLWRNIKYAEWSKKLALEYGTDTFHNYDIYLGANIDLDTMEERFCKQIYESHRKKVQRLKKKIEYYIKNYNCLWLTLTFTDKVLLNTCHDTRREYIRRFLKSFDPIFASSNIDYGDLDKNPESHEREHYHAIITLEHIDMSLYNYGFLFVKRINKNSKPAKLAEYTCKLTSHSFKDSTKGRDRVIYISRK